MSDELEVCGEMINKYIEKNRAFEKEIERLRKVIEILKCCENCDFSEGGDREEAGCERDCAHLYGVKYREGTTDYWRNKEC